jgi:hypothetical protein
VRRRFLPLSEGFGLTCHQFPNPRFKRFARHLTDFQSEAAQDSPNAQFHVSVQKEQG